MSGCQHDDCDRDAVAEWNGCNFCDEHVRERLRTTADSKLIARVQELETENARLNMEMVAYRQNLTPQDAAAMSAVIKALEDEKAARTRSEAPAVNNCDCPNGSYGKKHRDDCQLRQPRGDHGEG